jgi:predicted Rossmann-fold nucleotide-binding protein
LDTFFPSFDFPFTRKLVVTTPSEGCVFYPGGFGTLHQLFEVLTLIQTKKMSRVPVILVDHTFWGPLHTFIKEVLVHDVDTINDTDDELYQIVDSEESVFRVMAEFKV